MIAQSLTGDKLVDAEYILNNTSDSSVWIMKLSMMILPLICILIGFFLYQKKFKIDEEMYERICKDLEERNKK